MQLSDAIRTRRSTAALNEQAPTDATLAEFVALAAHSPDHAGLRPWRLITVRGDDRVRLGAALAAGLGDEPGSAAAAKTATKALRAPLLLAIVGRPVAHPKVPQWEQLAAVGAFVSTLQLVLHEAGFTAMWRTGPPAELAEVRTLHGLADTELMLGWLYIGGTAASSESSPPTDPDVSVKLSPLPSA